MHETRGRKSNKQVTTSKKSYHVVHHGCMQENYWKFKGLGHRTANMFQDN